MANYVSVEQLSLARIIVINNMNGKDVANHRYEVMYNAELFANSEVINEKNSGGSNLLICPMFISDLNDTQISDGDTKCEGLQPTSGILQTDTCDWLSAVKGARFQSAYRASNAKPASCAMRSSSDGHTKR